ncbi:type 4 pilus major pilin [Neokomagataea thailandica]|nr:MULTISPECIES: type 4 pilus major pilin [Neokomagataea]
MLALGGVATYAMRAYHGSSTTTATSEATDIYHSARGVFGNSVAGGSASYTNISNANSIKAGIVPSVMTTGDGQTIVGPWPGSSVKIFGNGITLWEEWDGVPASACATFALSQSVNYLTINGNAHPVMSNDPSLAANVASDCNMVNSNSTAKILFSYIDIGSQ